MKVSKLKLGLLLVVLLLLVSSTCLADSGTKTVGKITAQNYNDILEQWLDQQLRVYVDDQGLTYIGSGDIIPANAYFKDSERLQIIDLLKKGLEWSDKARTGQVELSKSLGSIKQDIGTEYLSHFNGIDLEFFAANKGKQTDIIITIYDFDNSFAKAELYLNNDMVKGLIDLLQKAPDTVNKLLEEEKVANDFQ